MKNIDNRFAVLELTESQALFDLYRVRDTKRDGAERMIKLYGKELRPLMFETMVNDSPLYSKMKHRHLVHFEEFRYLHSMDGKGMPTDFWYTITEVCDAEPLTEETVRRMSLREKLTFLLQTVQVTDYLNYMDFSYPLIIPENILMTPDGPKLRDVGTLEEQKHYAVFSDFSKFFLSPWFLQNRTEKNRRSDHYALARLMRYVLIENYREENASLWEPREEELREHLPMIRKYITEMQEASKLTDFMPDEFLTTEGSYLTMLRREWNRVFDLGFDVNFAEERGVSYFEGVVSGYSSYISEFDGFVKKIQSGERRSGGVLVEVERGASRSALFAEYCRRLELRGEPVFSLKLNLREEALVVTAAKELLHSPMFSISEEEEAKLSELAKVQERRVDPVDQLQSFRLIYGIFQKAARHRRFYFVIDGDMQEFAESFLNFTNFARELMENGKMMFLLSLEGSASELTTHFEELTNFVDEYHFLRQNLMHYSEEEIARYIKSCLGMPFLPMALSAEIFRETLGNPSYVEYVMKNMMESHYFYVDPTEGAWFLDVGDLSELSTSSPFDTTDAEQKEAIFEKYWAVLSRLSVFLLGASEEMLGKIDDSPNLERSLDELVQLKTVGKRIRENECFYKISFAELRNGIYARIPTEEKRQLHSTVANLLPTVYPAHSFSLIEENVYQLRRAGRLEDAVHYLTEEISYALGEDNVTSRIALLKRKVESIYEEGIHKVSSESMLPLLKKVIYLCFLESDYVGMDRYVKDSLRLSAKTGQLTFHLDALYYLTELQFVDGKMEEMRKTLDEMERLSRKHVSASGFIRTYVTEGRYFIRKGDIPAAVKCLKRAERMSEEYGISEYFGEIYGRLGLADYFSGRMESAKKYHEMARDCFHRQQNYVMELKMINNLVAFYDEGVMSYEEVTRYAEEGLYYAQKYRCLSVESLLYKNIALICFADFDVVSAYQYQLKAYDLCMHLNVKADIHEALIFLARCEVYFSRYAKASEILKEAERYYEGEETWDIDQRINYCFWMGEISFGFGKKEEAMAFFEKGMALSEKVNPRRYYEILTRRIQCGNVIGGDFLEKVLEDTETIIEALVNENSQRYFLLTVVYILEMRNRKEEAMALLQQERTLGSCGQNSILDALSDLLLFLLEPTDENLEPLKRNQKFYVNDPMLSFHYFLSLARAFDRRGEYGVAIRNYINVFNIIYTSIYEMEDFEMKRLYLESYGGDRIHDRILEIADKLLGKTRVHLTFSELTEENFDRYFDLSEAMRSLDWRMLAPGSSEEWENSSVIDDNLTLSDVVLHMGTKYQQNLEMLLRYLTKKTMSQHGAVVVYDREADGPKVIASLGFGGDRVMMNEPLLTEMQSEKDYILVDVRDKQQYEKKLYLICSEKKSLLAVPFRFDEHYTAFFDKNHERRELRVQSTKNNGFIYLEADTMLHTFAPSVVEELRPIFNLIRTNVDYYLMRRTALFDYLTGCLSRRSFDVQFADLMEGLRTFKARCSVLMLDIDNFKSVNDTYGHQVGDKVLRKLGEILRNNVRKTDIVARYGGEEFIIALPADSDETGSAVAEKIRAEMESTTFEGIPNNLTISIGIAHFPEHSQLKDDLVKKADMALYESKRQGKNQVTVWHEGVGEGFHHSDKLAGIVTGHCDVDNKLMLAIFDVASLLRDNMPLREKLVTFLHKVEDVCGLDDSCLMLQDNDVWETVSTEGENGEERENFCGVDYILSEVGEDGAGVCHIDWNGHLTEGEASWGDWLSYMAIPLYKSGKRKAIFVGWAKLKRKELGREDFNRATLMTEIFAGVLR